MNINNPSLFSRSPGKRAMEEEGEVYPLYLPSLPLFLLQPILNHIVEFVRRKNPDIFMRLGPSANKIFLINPTDLPFFLILKPNHLRPSLRAYNNKTIIDHDVYISAKFITLLKLIDAQTDSDALFFNRNIKILGDSEAMVALRNALDDLDDSLAQNLIDSFGLLSAPAGKFINFLTGKPRSKN